MAYHQIISDLHLSANLQQQLKSLVWRQLPVTTDIDRLVVLRRMIRTRDNWLDYLVHYGWKLQRIATLKNLRIDRELEEQVVDIVQKHFGCSESPVVRLQVMFGGQMLPLHIDTPKHASLIIPIDNHSSASTHFYQALRPVDPALPNPLQCDCVESIVISQPTLIDTDCIHNVMHNAVVTKQHPRISVTAKWTSTKFSDLAKAVKQ